MKAINDPISLLKQMVSAAERDPESQKAYANNRKQRLHTACYTQFDPDAFAESLEKRVQPLLSGTSDEIPIIAGVPVTDLLAYGRKRMSEMPRQNVASALNKVESTLWSLLDVGHVSAMPISVAIGELADGKIHIPTFGEVVFQHAASESIGSVIDSREYGLKLVSHFERFITSMSKIDPNAGSRSEPLAIIGLQLAYGHRDTISFMHDSALATASAYLLENHLPKFNDSVISNLIDTASNTGVDLRQLKMSQTIPLDQYFSLANRRTLADKFESECIRADSMNIINQNQHRISHDYDPNNYFDM